MIQKHQVFNMKLPILVFKIHNRIIQFNYRTADMMTWNPNILFQFIQENYFPTTFFVFCIAGNRLEKSALQQCSTWYLFSSKLVCTEFPEQNQKEVI